VPALGVFVTAGLLLAAFGTGTAPAALKTVAAVKPTANQKVSIITVTAGKPSELAFKLSKTSLVRAGAITFKVTNMGVAFHNFKICATPLASAASAKDACTGKATPILKHGQSATLTVTITKSGKYEFLCTVTGHAAAGMKGLLGVGVAVATSEQKAAAAAAPASTGSGSTGGSTGGGTTTTTPKSSGGGGSGGSDRRGR